MSAREENFCRLCFTDNPRIRYQKVDDVTRDIIDVLLINVDFDVCSDAVICSECAEFALKCLRFKLACVSKEQQRLCSILNNSTNKIAEEKSVDKFYKSLCTFCMDSARNNLSSISDLKHHISVEFWPMFFPEKNYCSPKDSKACPACLSKLTNYFFFLFNCFKSKKKMDAHLQQKIERMRNNTRHTVIVLKLKKHQCPSCPFETNEKTDLTLHIKLVHDNFDKHNCPNCDFVTKRKYNLTSHLKTIHNVVTVKKYKCSDCRFETDSRGYLERHMKRKHNTSIVVRYKCEKCPFETKRKPYLSIHMIKQHGCEVKKYKCLHCAYETKLEVAVKRHLKIQHNIVEKHNCPRCRYETDSKYAITFHMKKFHDLVQLKTYKCGSCNFETKYKRSLYTHLMTQHINVHFISK